jgi:hypothetical protein
LHGRPDSAIVQSMKHAMYQEFLCRECGLSVCWAESRKSGKTYLAQPKPWSADGYSSQNGKNNQRTFYPGHYCEPNAEYKAECEAIAATHAVQHTDDLAAGMLVKKQRVTIVAGRKFPIGTEGNVFWIAERADGYDAWKVGIITDTEEKLFVDMKNIAITSTGRRICRACWGTKMTVGKQNRNADLCTECTDGTTAA